MEHLIEIRRQFAHMYGILIVPLAVMFGGRIIGEISFFVALLIFLYSEYMARRRKIRKIIKIRKLYVKEDVFHRFINMFERRGNNYRGAFYFYFSSGITLMSFSLNVAILSITVLAIGDSFATLVGIFGKRKIFFNKSKTWEGAIACFVSSFIFCFFINPVLAFPAALIGTIVESLPMRMDDNLTMPVITAFGLSLLV